MRRVFLGLAFAIGLWGCADQDFVLVNLVSLQGTPPPIDTLEVRINGGEAETVIDLGGQFVVPLASSGDDFDFVLDFPPAFRGQEISLEIRGLREGVDVLSGEASAVVGRNFLPTNVFVQFCGNETADPLRGEECDDANNIEGDGCDSNCTLSACGNGIFAPGELCFAPPIEFPIGDRPNSITAGDFNNDGFLDVAAANLDSDDVSVLLGKGDGSFEGVLDFQVGERPNSIKAGDLNGDGSLDLVITNEAFSVSILLNNNNNTFHQLQLNLGTTRKLLPTILKDINLDSILDIIITSTSFKTSVAFLINNGDGNFQNQSSFEFSTGVSLAALTTGNFNNDGFIDIALVNRELSRPGNVSVALGQGSNFESPQEVATIGVNPSSVLSKDFDQDNFLDLVISNKDSDNVSILMGNGDGTFQTPINLPVGDAPQEVIVEDLNLDRFLDLIVVNSGSNNVSILLGNGDGTFRIQQTFTAGARPLSVAAGDFNGDGLLDLVTANSDADSVSVLLFDP